MSEVYVIDMITDIDPFDLGLREPFENERVIKIFHDFCEDAAALVNHHNVHVQSVFDT